MLKILTRAMLAGCLMIGAAKAADAPDPTNWPNLLTQAKGQTVYWHAWGGEPRINDYIAWAGREIEERYGVELVHVKVQDTGSVVSQVLAEKTAGTLDGGSVDLIWINGENFAAMKREGLLLSEGWANKLPNFQYVDVSGKPTVINDFTVPTDGLEAPWGMAQLVFFNDTAISTEVPTSMEALLEWSAANPGRFSYPQPPDYVGSTFLKQALYELVTDPTVLQQPADEADFAAVTEPLLAYLDKLHPHMWRSGRAFPQNTASLRQLMADGELEIGFAFNPAAASNAIANNELPDSVRSFVLETGTIGNTHFVAIPFNANAKAGAMVLADFLMSPEAQLRKQDPNVWGDPTVLDVKALPAAARKSFEELDLGVATLSPSELGIVLPEPHPSWMVELEKVWLARYGV
ncbi:MAG: ABC transporter substrate-binding protein [Alphaproteobacteria bacterium]|nr:ABC transporter substrate-binding protein [Alphaproteobacteria bacterium]